MKTEYDSYGDRHEFESVDLKYWTLTFLSGNGETEIRISGIRAARVEDAENLAREKWNIGYHLSDSFEGV